MEVKIKPIFEEIAKKYEEEVPEDWKLENIADFSYGKRLFEYQIEAIKNINTLLYLFFKGNYFNDFQELKSSFFKNYVENEPFFNSIKEEVEYISDRKNKALRHLLLKGVYPFEETSKGDRRVHFSNFINRAAFWMATGSGKTLVIVKLIELLDYLMRNNKIPRRKIMVLTLREDLINQIKKHVDEYNEAHDVKIRLKELPSLLRNEVLSFENDINVYIYRSDLIAEKTSEKEISYEEIQNNGEWYLILDEAHKGTKEDSNRKIFYSYLTRNGFLFNFSATFTEDWDILTTVYNLSLPNYIERGYGKQILIVQKSIEKIQKLTEEERKKIMLKSLLLFALIKKAKNELGKNEKLKEILKYHNPLLVIYADTVNVARSKKSNNEFEMEPDLKILFNLLAEIAISPDEKLLENAKKELIEDIENSLKSKGNKFPENTNIENINDEIRNLTKKDILRYVYNSEAPGEIEVIKLSKNNPESQKELIFKLKSSDRYFALLRIGDVSRWLKEKLENVYHISERPFNESLFQSLDKLDSPAYDINILLGSRAFIEGWDSNRPNEMMFINIGLKESEKYILQAIGRGERIEPIKGERKRLFFITKDELNEIKEEVRNKGMVPYINLLETLFIFGTKQEVISKSVEALKELKKEEFMHRLKLYENEKVKNKILLVPKYKEVRSSVSELKEYVIRQINVKRVKEFVNWLEDDRLLLPILGFSDVNTLEVIKSGIEKVDESINPEKDSDPLQDLRLVADFAIRKVEKLDNFKELGEGDIQHYKEIYYAEEPEELQKVIDEIYKEVPELDKLVEEHSETSFDIIERASSKEVNGIKIKYILQHYYVPVVMPEIDKARLFENTIKEESEKEFLEELEKFTFENRDKIKSKWDYWFFSKVEQKLDRIYVPYYNSQTNGFARFYPDFIFWLKKGNEYRIVFVDPKSVNFTDYENKVEGYVNIFTEDDNKEIKKFKRGDTIISVSLYFYTNDWSKVKGKGYREYWIDKNNLGKIFDLV